MTEGWKITLVVPAGATELFSAALAPHALAVSDFEVDGGDSRTIDAYCASMPDGASLGAGLALAAVAAGVPEPEFQCVPLPATDWLAENRKSFAPVRAGRYFVHPSHFDGVRPAGAVAIQIDAASAFGSGEHASTMGCLLALDGMARRGRVGRALDLGCGSGILTIAMAKQWRGRVVAADIDREAVRVSRANMHSNGVTGHVRVVHGKGFAHPAVRTGGPFGLIVANILARPLIGLAPDVAAHLAESGIAVLSGILTQQSRWVAGAYRHCGLRLLRELPTDGWSTLILRR